MMSLLLDPLKSRLFDVVKPRAASTSHTISGGDPSRQRSHTDIVPEQSKYY